MLVRWIGLVLVLLLAAFAGLFAAGNPHEVMVKLPGDGVLFFVGSLKTPLFGLVFVTLCLGFLMGALTNWSAHLRCRRRNARKLRQIQDLEEELTNLRNLPLEHDAQF
ncbi:MAG: LapA family protein [Magnetococcales bacterium]|nr:LapA family protein [Magnetococcales bacterium]